MNIGEITKTIATIALDLKMPVNWTVEQLNKIYELVNYDILKKKYGFPKDIHGAENNQQIIDSLLPFKSAPTAVALTLGIGDMPDDYMHLLTCTASGRMVDIITQLEDVERETSPVRSASTRYPTAIIEDDQIRVKPTSISSVTIVYIKRPTTPVYAVTQTDGIYVYDASSIQFDWKAEHDIDIIRYTLEYMGITMRNDQILPYVQNKKIEEN